MSQMAQISEAQDNNYSIDFPLGYGDFELKSSDNVIFSFPRGILAHVSPVFKDMFSIGDTDGQHEPLNLTEDSKTIRQFLLYIDPLKYSPGFTLDTAESLIEAATKYQVAIMVETFENWAVTGSACISHDAKSDVVSNGSSPIKKDPMLFLSLAEKFCLPEIGSISMRDAVVANKRATSISKYPLNRTTIIQFVETRQERTRMLIEKVTKLIRDEIDIIRWKIGTSLSPQSGRKRSQLERADTKSSGTTNIPECFECLKNLYDLVVGLSTRLLDHPTWSAFILEGEEKINTPCAKCSVNLWQHLTVRFWRPSFHRSDFDILEEEILKVESERIPLNVSHHKQEHGKGQNKLHKMAQTSNDSPTTQYSTEFPSGYGDFELKSSDNVVFSFSRGVLAHMSPVFKDMFSIGDTSNPPEPLAITEDSPTITCFLLYIDPLKDRPDLTRDAAESFLEWNDEYPIKENPMLFLSLAERFNLTEDSYPIDGNREERAQLLIDKIGKLMRTQANYIESRAITSSLSDYSLNQKPICSYCIGQFYDLMAGLTSRLLEKPSWLTFTSVMTKTPPTRCGHDRWEKITETRIFESLEAEIRSVESAVIPLKALGP
ncbi:4508_t:CDS:2 [Acaulospora colombiana]|uniref:4508_t:CDS:1 n=1 Tax=Acaulospora colombiana TaxID=27376 RepID=A0ACA9N1R5_9GLOM|nr:4508_t:CDS:2 [Acaulospora colombiana]